MTRPSRHSTIKWSPPKQIRSFWQAMRPLPTHLAFAIYCLSSNPVAQAHVLNEVDTFFASGQDEISVEDIDEKVRPNYKIQL